MRDESCNGGMRDKNTSAEAGFSHFDSGMRDKGR